MQAETLWLQNSAVSNMSAAYLARKLWYLRRTRHQLGLAKCFWTAPVSISILLIKAANLALTTGIYLFSLTAKFELINSACLRMKLLLLLVDLVM